VTSTSGEWQNVGVRRADRLFQLVGILSRRRTVTAQRLSEELEVSVRTVYRDVLDLVASGVPILGEAGVGYRLDPAYRLPPMTFTNDEIEALVLGMRMVESWGDAALRASARSILDKVAAVTDSGGRGRLSATALFSLDFSSPRAGNEYLKPLRDATNEHRVVRFRYEDRTEQATRRSVRPLGLYFWGRTWTLAAYCDLRVDFRNFRVDRMTELVVLEERFEAESPFTIDAYVKAMRERD
jgi:predicted DNA-binding transcriptional regulator YafY